MTANSEDVITCKVCGQVDPLSKKFKCSKCGAKNWGHPLPAKNKGGCLWEIVFGVLLLAGYIIYTEVKKYNNDHWSQQEIEMGFSKNVVLVYHQFAYELKFDDPEDGSLFFVRTEDGRFTQWQKGMQPNEIAGCGLIVKQDGTCATTRNITHPWLSDLDLINLRREVQVFRNEPFNIRSGGQYRLFTVKLGYYDHGSKINDPASFNPCVVGESLDKEIDKIIVQNRNKTIPGIKEFNHPGTLPEIKKDDELFFIGYPVQISKTENLNTLVTKNKVDSMNHTEFYFPFTVLFTLEGAPVFNRKGDVIGLTTVDERGKIKAIRSTFVRVKKE